jgi:AcrR family transcriptional regulator
MSVDELRNQVLNAGLLVFARDGFRGATIEAIAREAGVSRQALYDQFADKAELFAQVVAQIEAKSTAAMSDRLRDYDGLTLGAWLRASYRLALEENDAYPDWRAVLEEAERNGNPAMTRKRNTYAAILVGNSRERWDSFSRTIGREPVPFEVSRVEAAQVALCFGMLEAIMDLRWPGGPPPDRDTLVEFLTEFTLGGLVRVQTKIPEIVAKLG